MPNHLYLIMFFPPGLFASIGLAIALHHCYKHRDRSRPENAHAHSESCPIVCLLQPSDVANHETWIVALFAASISWLISAGCLASVQC